MILRILSTASLALGSVLALVGVAVLPTALLAWVGIGAGVGLSAPILSEVFRSPPLPAAAQRRTAWLAGTATTGFLLMLVGSITVLGAGAGTGLALLLALGWTARRTRRPGPATPPPDPAGSLPTLRIEDATTPDLCRFWQRSWSTMSDLGPGPLRDQVVELRGQVLEELEHRHPDGVRRWLESGARADGDPARFLPSGG